MSPQHAAWLAYYDDNVTRGYPGDERSKALFAAYVAAWRAACARSLEPLHCPVDCECGLCEVPNDGTPDSSEPRTHLDP